jgi:hypothetical protein
VRQAVVDLVAKRLPKGSKMDVVPVTSEAGIKAAVNRAPYDRIVYVGHASTSAPMLLPNPAPQRKPGSNDLHRIFIDSAVLVPTGEKPARIDLITCSTAATGAQLRISQRLDEGAVVTGYTDVIVFLPDYLNDTTWLESIKIDLKTHNAKFRKVVTPPVPSVTRDVPKD